MNYDESYREKPAAGIAKIGPSERFRLDRLRAALAEATTLPEIKKVLNIAEAARVYAKSAHLGREQQNRYAEYAVLAAWKAGGILKQLEKSPGGNYPHGSPATLAADSQYAQTLKDTSTPPRTARYWQKLFCLPEKIVLKYLSDTQHAEKGEITVAGLLRDPASRDAFRAAKKAAYTEVITTATPRVLEGTYRILYADPPWKYVGLNKADEYGHAERHYDCLTDEQLCAYKVGRTRLVRDVLDNNAVLFLWVTSPLLERCFSVIKAWGVQYKSSFVWDKVRHNIGHYNSMRHELLLVCTKGSCKPDSSKLIDSVVSIERSGKHSEKPERFYNIIESLYSYGRKLELFSRKQRKGWDSDGNEARDLYCGVR